MIKIPFKKPKPSKMAIQLFVVGMILIVLSFAFPEAVVSNQTMVFDESVNVDVLVKNTYNIFLISAVIFIIFGTLFLFR